MPPCSRSSVGCKWAKKNRSPCSPILIAWSCFLHDLPMDATRALRLSSIIFSTRLRDQPQSQWKLEIFDAIRKASETRHLGLVTWSSKWFQQRILPGNHHISHISWLIYCIFWTLIVVVFDLLLIFLLRWFKRVFGVVHKTTSPSYKCQKQIAYHEQSS